jgi:hypothetical protein
MTYRRRNLLSNASTGVRTMNITVKDNKLTITVDLATQPVRSASGKMDLLATTHGFQPVAGATVNGKPVKLSLNVGTKA